MKTNIKLTLSLISLLALTACGGGGASENTPSPVIITNASPSATAQTHTIDEDNSLALVLSGTDSDGSISSYAVTTQPTNGVLTGSGAELTYTPTLNFNGSDSLAFTVTDNEGATSIAATIDITINPVIDVPNATAQTHVIDEDVNLALILSGTDSDGTVVIYSVTTQPTNGALTGVGPNFTYTPTLNFNGTDTLAFTVTDNDGAISNEASVNITINPVNDAPVIALGDSYDVSENTSATGLLLNLYATDPEQDDISVSLGQEADSGLFSIDSGTNELLFHTPPDFENPTDSDNNNSYQVSVVYTDSAGAENSELIEVIVTDESDVQVVMTFPTPNANLGGQATEISLKGRLTDGENADSPITNISSLSINGVNATLSDDNTNWTATIPISEQTTDLSFELTNDSETLPTSTQQLRNVELPASFELPYDGAYDSENNRLIFLEGVFYNAVMALDLATNELSVLSNAELGTGVDLERARGMALDLDNNRVFVSDSDHRAIFTVSLATGNRTIISDDNMSSGTGFISPRGLQYDGSNNQLYLIDSGLDALIKIDVTTGDRSIISDDNAGSGDVLSFPYGLEIDIESNTAYIADFSEDKIFTINLTTGNRTVIASSEIGSGVSLSEPRNLLLNNDKTSLILTGLASDKPALIELDLSTFNRTILSNQNTGAGVNFEASSKIIADGATENVWVLDLGVEGIISTELVTGNRELLTDPNFESNFLDPTGIILDPSNDRLLVMDKEALVTVDISGTNSSGNITVLSGSTTGSGPSLVDSNGIAHDQVNNRIFTISNNEDNDETLITIDLETGVRTQVVDFHTYVDTSNVVDFAYDSINNRIIYIESSGSDTLVSVDLTTGSFTEISDFSTADGSTLIFALSIALDIENNIAYVTNLLFESIYAVDLTSGLASVISNVNIGTGPLFDWPYGLTMDTSNNRLLVADSKLDQIIAVDLSTGDRTIISDSTPSAAMRAISNPVLDSENNRLFIADFAEDNIYVIDTETGERAYVTH